MTEFFRVPAIRYEGAKSTNPFSFKHYNRDETEGGKTVREQLSDYAVSLGKMTDENSGRQEYLESVFNQIIFGGVSHDVF